MLAQHNPSNTGITNKSHFVASLRVRFLTEGEASLPSKAPSSLSMLHAEKLGGTLVKDEEAREKLHVYSLPGSKLCMFTIGLSTYMYVSMHERMYTYMMEGLLLLVKPNIYIHIYNIQSTTTVTWSDLQRHENNLKFEACAWW